jgi:2-methylisocitrate lyase-like PEP mutase family enzyme
MNDASINARAERFARLHAAPDPFILLNVWDAGTARIAAGLGFQALATSSAACANTLGRADGEVTRDEALAHARALVAATDLPVSADLENGFGDDPRDAAETVRLAAASGLAGCSIEDAPRDGGKPYALAHAVERAQAAVEAARALGRPFVLTVRAENFVRGVADLDDTLARLLAFERTGADVLFAPGLPDLAAVRTVCAAVARPVSFMASGRGRSFSLAELAAAGVRRVSVATSLYRAAMTAFIEAAQEIRERGTFGYVERALTGAELERYLGR